MNILKVLKDNKAYYVTVQNENENTFIKKEYRCTPSQNIRQEFILLKTIENSGIIKPLEYKSEDSGFIKFEYKESSALEDFLINNNSHEIINNLFLNLSHSIAYIHSCNICLNELNPEGILIQENLPVIYDLSKACVNLGNTYGEIENLAFASPEKILRGTNHLANDIFSLGILYIFCFSNNTICDIYDNKTYINLINNEELFYKTAKSIVSDDFIIKMISINPLNRPTIIDVCNYFIKKCKLNSLDLKESSLKLYDFKVQKQTVKKLLKKRKLKIEYTDEPHKIENLLSLHSESELKRLIILDEKQFINNPDEFFKPFPIGYRDNQIYHHKLIEFIQKSNFNILLKRSEQINPTDLFDEIENKFDCFVFTESKTSELKDVSINEINELSQSLELKISNNDKSKIQELKPFKTRLFFIEKFFSKNKKDAYNELIIFSQWIGMPVPVAMTELIWENCFTLIREAVVSQYLKIEGDTLINITDNKGQDIPKELLSTILEKLKNTSYYSILGKINFLINKKESAMEYWNKYLDYLIKQQYFISAYEFLTENKNKVGINSFTFEIKKKYAFISRIIGKFEDSKQLYEKLIDNSEGVIKAILLCDYAIVLQALNKFETAIDIYKNAIDLFKTHKDWKSLFRAMNNLGVVFFKLKQFTDAESLFNDVLLQAKILNNLQFETISYLNLADLSCKRGEWNKAIFYCDKAIKIAEVNSKWNLVVNGAVIKAKSLFAQGSNEHAVEILLNLLENKQTVENQLIMQEIIACLLHIYICTDLNKAENLLSEFSLPTDDMHEILAREMFFYYFFKKSFLKAGQMASSVTDNTILTAFLDSDYKVIFDKLKEFKLQNESDTYLYYLTYYFKSDLAEDNPIQNENYYDDIKLFEYKPAEKAKNTVTENLSCFLLNNLIKQLENSKDIYQCLKIVFKEIINLCDFPSFTYIEIQNGTYKPALYIEKFGREIELENLRFSKQLLKQLPLEKTLFYEPFLLSSDKVSISPDLIGLGINSVLAYPFFIGNELRGFVYAESTLKTDISEKQLKLIETIFKILDSFFEKIIINQKNNESENYKIIDKQIENKWEIIGNSKAIQDVYSKILMVATYNVNVLITGPTGVGKELVAKAIHQMYVEKSRIPGKTPFIAVNCAAIPEQLLESELFGYKKGAFTGAVSDQKGKILEANNGTLFLDEIGEMPLILQAKLLRVIQEKTVNPLGTGESIPVSVRIITATNRNLEEMVTENLFRADLFYRLKVITVNIPPLDERTEDIPLLIMHFIKKFNIKFDKNITGIQPGAMRILQSKKWKGNIRELENEIERAVLMCNTDLITPDDLSNENNNENSVSFSHLPLLWSEYREYKSKICSELDKKYITQLLEQSNNNVSLASKIAKMERIQVYRLLKNEE